MTPITVASDAEVEGDDDTVGAARPSSSSFDTILPYQATEKPLETEALLPLLKLNRTMSAIGA